MGLPAIVDIELCRGDSALLAFRWMTGTTGSSTAVDVSAYTGRLAIGDWLGATALSYTTDAGSLAVGTGGTMAATVTPVQSAGLTQCGYAYTLAVTSPGGARTTVFRGAVLMT
jgi:hypothetical protein